MFGVRIKKTVAVHILNKQLLRFVFPGQSGASQISGSVRVIEIITCANRPALFVYTQVHLSDMPQISVKL